MKKQTLTLTFHFQNPNSNEKTVAMLVKIAAEVAKAKLQNEIICADKNTNECEKC